jgi:hypothetical protein
MPCQKLDTFRSENFVSLKSIKKSFEMKYLKNRLKTHFTLYPISRVESMEKKS